MSRLAYPRIVVLLCAVAVAVLPLGCGNDARTKQASPTIPAEATASSEVFTRTNWSKLVADPESYKGASVDIVGQVFFEPNRHSDGVYWQMYADPGDWEWNTLVAYHDPSFPISDHGFVHVIGEVVGEYAGENLFGAKITAVLILASEVEIVDATAAADPSIRTALVHQKKVQNGVAIEIQRVDFARDETRVFVKVTNRTDTTATFFGFTAKATQGATQYDPEYQWNYPKVQSELLPGIVSEGVVLFPAMNSSEAVTIYLEASSGDWSADFEPYIFVIPNETDELDSGSSARTVATSYSSRASDTSGIIRTAVLDKSMRQHDVTVTLQRVEFTQEDTRVFVEVTNGLETTAVFFAFTATATQGTTQYDVEYQWDRPGVQTELLPGIVSEGVVLFPAMNSSEAVEFCFEAGSDEGGTGRGYIHTYVFEVPDD
jgi:hypothetical protein